MFRLTKFLSKLGLSSKEMQLYLACYKYGASSASTLARVTTIPRSSIYDHAEKLVKKGFLKINTSEGNQEFIATSPQDIQYLLIRKGNELLHQANDLEEMFSEFSALKIQENTAPVHYSEGREAYSLLIQKLQFSYSRSMFKVELLLSEDTHIDLPSILAMNSDPKIHGQKIIEATDLGKEYAYKVQLLNPNIQVKLLPENIYVQSDHILVDDIFYHMSYDKKLKIFQINDPIFYATQKTMFDLVWKSL